MSIQEDIAAIPDPSKKFLEWIGTMLIRSPLQVQILLESILLAGKASTPRDALLYLNDFMRRYSFDGLKVTTTDLGLRGRRNSAFIELRRRVDGRISRHTRQNDRSRFYGTLGHMAIPELLTGKLGRCSEISAQASLFSGSDIVDTKPSSQVVTRELIRYWQEFASYMQEAKDYQWFYAHRRRVGKFYALLQRLFGDYVPRIMRAGFFQDEYLLFLTFMSWAAAVAWHQKMGDMAILTETPVISSSYAIEGGRVDAIEMITSGHDVMTPLLRAQIKFQSVGHVMTEATQMCDGPMTLVIRDWKFAVGDGESSMNRHVIDVGDIAQTPIQGHVSQMERYLGLAHCDFVLFHRRRSKGEIPHMAMRGELIYFMPDRLPVVHVIAPSVAENDKLARELALRWKDAQLEARFREVTTLLFHHATTLLGESKGRASARLVNQGLLFPGRGFEHPFERMVHEYLT